MVAVFSSLYDYCSCQKIKLDQTTFSNHCFPFICLFVDVYFSHSCLTIWGYVRSEFNHWSGVRKTYAVNNKVK